MQNIFNENKSVAQLTTENIMARLNNLVRSRYQCELSYIPFLDTDVENRPLRERLLLDGHVEQGDCLYFPVLIAFQLAGAARIAGPNLPDSQQRQELADLLELLLETAIVAGGQLDLLEQTELKIRSCESAKAEPDNVIPLPRVRNGISGDEVATPKTRRLHFTIPCLIEAQNLTDIKLLANELHELSGRYAMVQYGDLKLSGLPSEIRELGPMTIFVPDITALSHTEQVMIKQYLNGFRNIDCPQIIAGTTTAYAKLRDENRVDVDLLRAISVGYLRMTRPFSEYKREGIFDFFFTNLLSDDLSGRLT